MGQSDGCSDRVPLSLARDELCHDPRFAGAAILHQPFAGNPFPLTEEERAAIADHHRQTSASTEERTAMPWTLRPGDHMRRTELHARYGGSGQSGISPSRTTPNILVFTDPRSGERHGYFDQWAPDDSFHYTGEGQRGNQTMTKSKLAILNHRADGRALRVFQGATGTVQYAGQSGGSVWRFKSQRSMWTVLVVAPDVDPKDLLEVAAPNNEQPVQARGADRIHHSAYALARGACTGVARISAPSSRTTSSKARENFASCPRSK